jgi:hypothetical protein
MSARPRVSGTSVPRPAESGCERPETVGKVRRPALHPWAGDREEGVGPMDDGPTEVSRTYRQADGAIMCSCGDRLADSIDGDAVVIDGMEFRFRRRSDEMTCRSCGTSHPVRQFRFGAPAPRDTGQRRRRTD